MPRPAGWWALGLALVLACEGSNSVGPTLASSLAPGVVAVVGDEAIDARQVSLIAAARGLTTRGAREAAIHDALFAAASRADGSDRLELAETRVLSRALLAELTREATRAPIDGAELENWTMARFIDVDRPPGFRVVHAVVLVDAALGEDARRAARDHAERLRTQVAPLVREASSLPAPIRHGEDVFLERSDLPEDPLATRFREAYNAFDHREFDTRFEALGVVSEDGRYVDYARSPWDRVSEDFSRAAARLDKRGDLSPVVETELEANGKTLRGYHVIALLERTEARRLSEAERREYLTPIVHDARAQSARKKLLEELRSRTKVTLARNATSLLEALNESATTSKPGDAP
jgi:hypothetical protein